jgi:hypothetical protein
VTRTHTHFFTDEDLRPLVAMLDELHEDWNDRRPHMSEDIAIAGDTRIAVAKAGVLLMAEPVPE